MKPCLCAPLAVAFVTACSAYDDGCTLLDVGSPIKATVSPRRPACFLVDVMSDDPAQLTIEQPDDLVIRLQGTAAKLVVDGFDSGIETVTMTTADRYRVEVSVESQPSKTAPLTLFMSRKAVPLQLGESWARAEALATMAKQTRKLEDIASSLRLWEELGNRSAVGRTYLKRGSALLRAGDFVSARQAYDEAAGICRSLPDLRCLAEAANNSGSASSRLGDIDDALKRWTEAAQAWRQISSNLEGRTLSNLAFLFWQTGDYQRAIAMYDRARLILKKSDPIGHAILWNNLGLCYLSLAEYAQARACFRRSLTEARRLKSATNAVNARLNLGRAHMLDGLLVPAQAILERALDESLKQENQASRAGVFSNLGQTLWRRHQLDDAEARLNRALEIHRSLKDRRGEASDLHYLGLIERERRNVERARQLLEQAVKIRRDCGLRDDVVDSLSALAELDFDTGDAAGARAAAEQAMTLLESIRTQVPGSALRASFYGRRRKFLDLLVDIEMGQGIPHSVAEGLLAAERGRARALLDLLAEGSLGPRLSEHIVERRISVRRQIELLSRRLAAMPVEQGGQLSDRIQLLLSEDDQIEATIRQSIQTRESASLLTSVARLQRELLPGNTALIEYHLGERRSWLWLVQSDTVEAFALPGRRIIEAQVARAVDLFGHVLERRRSPEKQVAFERGTRELSRTLLGPLRDRTLPARLVLVLDGALHRVPFPILWSGRKQERLGLVHDLVQVPSAAYLANGAPPRAVGDFPKTILAIADPVFSRNDVRVPIAAKVGVADATTTELPRLLFNGELDTISQLVPVSRRHTLRGFEANAATLQHLPLRDYAFLHFSTHATIDDRIPELSRIALSMMDRVGRSIDGFMRPHQLAGLQLNGSTIVLSACDTALGKEVIGEGLAGFTSSLFHAGASQLVLTLTKVDAEASSQFFSDVYRRTLSARPATMDHALTLARRVFARSTRWSDPYYWGAFIVIGRPVGTAVQRGGVQGE